MANHTTNRKGSRTEEPGKGQSQATPDHKMLMIVFIALVIDLLAFTMILPLLPALLDYYGNNEDSLYRIMKSSVSSFRQMVGAPDTPRWNSVLFGGVIGSLFSLLQFLASPVLGAASDFYGRKPIMIFSMLGIAASYAVWAVSHNFIIFVIARIIGGISKGNISLSTAIVTDICPPEKRARGMAVIGVAFSVGFIIGPLIGAFFSQQARIHDNMFFTGPALFALLLALTDVLFVIICLKETLPQNKRAKTLDTGLKRAKYLLSPISLFKFEAVDKLHPKDLKVMRNIGGIYFLYLFLYSGLEFTLTFLTYNRFNFDSLQQGKMFFVIGILMALVQGGYVRRLPPGLEMRTSIIGMSLLIPSFIMIGLAYHQWVLYTGLLLYAFASATVVPCMSTVISSYGSDDQKGTVLGIFRSLGALARAVGPVVASTLYWSAGPGVCYAVGGISFIIPITWLCKTKALQHTD